MTSREEDDIPLAKRQKHLQQERGVETKLPQTEVQEEKTVSPDSDYIVIDSSEDEDVINAAQPVSTAAAAHKPSAAPLPRKQWQPIPLRPINYGRKSVSVEKEVTPLTNGTAPAATATAKEEIITEEEEEVIELSSTTEEEEEEDELETAKRVEQEVILLGHGSSDDERIKQKQQTLKRPRGSSPPRQRPPSATTLPKNRQVPPSSAAPSGSKLNTSSRILNNGTRKTTMPPTRPPVNSRSTVLDTPYEFQSREAGAEFKRKFTSTSTTGVVRQTANGYPVINQSAVDKRAKQILHEMKQTKQQAAEKSEVAWTAAAMKWREKNKPSEAELRRRAQEDSARISEAARLRAKVNPMAHRAAEFEGTRNKSGGANGNAINDTDDPPPRRPAANAPELERRSYYRAIAQRKVTHAGSFDQVLKLLGVPCDDPSQIKYSYRIAVRMFHPDSNSKDKVWSTPEEKVQAEEVMKIINERKERNL